jgi:8-oxo-dGTP pyrophosphatase MutT (NUDIX family)
LSYSSSPDTIPPARWSPPPRIRPIVICIVRRDDALLVFEARDESKNETFYRPLGGGIEFGEYGETAIRREMREELGVELRDVRYVGALENIYTMGLRPGHEIVLVFEASLVDEHRYALDEMVGHEENGRPFKVLWAPLAQFRAGAARLYPEGLLELLDSVAAEASSPCRAG